MREVQPNQTKTYRGFSERLHHEVPHWVGDAALFHIRIRLEQTLSKKDLTEPHLALALLESARFYQSTHRWHITIFLIMPNHLHTIVSFGRDQAMSEVVRNWKRFQTKQHGIVWQENYFDHRLREDASGHQVTEKVNYIRQNPVVAGLCKTSEEWPWKIEAA